MYRFMQSIIQRKKDEEAEKRLFHELQAFKQKTESLNFLREQMKTTMNQQEIDEREKLLRDLSSVDKSPLDIKDEQ